MILVLPTRQAPIRLQLGECFLPAPLLIQGKSVDLPNGRRPRRQSLGSTCLDHGPLGVAPLQELGCPAQGRKGSSLITRRGRLTNLSFGGAR